MRRLLTFWSAVVLCFCGLLALADERDTAPRIENIRLGIDGTGQTRVVLDLDDDPRFLIVPQVGNTSRMLIDVRGGIIDMPANVMPGATGIVGEVSVSGSTVDLALLSPALPVKSFVIRPSKQNAKFRLVIDLRAVSARDFAVAAAKAAEIGVSVTSSPEAVKSKIPKENGASSAPSRKKGQRKTGSDTPPPDALTNSKVVAPSPRLKPARLGGRKYSAPRRAITIVLDPGHGGHDPGATGSTGLKEKAITLETAQLLAVELRHRGYGVILTRDADEYVGLEDRIAFARERQADLFMSLHADANPEPLARGATVYTLSDARSNEMTENAARTGNFKVFDVDLNKENPADRDVGSILFDIANTDTQNHSVKLATAVIAEMRGRVPMVNNSHRRMSLGVLLSPDVPAVLVELAFLSNKNDEANLASEQWRARTTLAIADGIDLYFENNEGRRSARRPAPDVVNP